jgi:ketosteroid isomerase-like protein
VCPSCVGLADKSGTKGSGQMPDDEQAIRELTQTWLAATQKGDIQTVLSLMMDDVIFMVPGSPVLNRSAKKLLPRALKH